MRKRDLTGRRFGRLTVIARCPRRGPSNSVYWICKCDCGGDQRTTTHVLTSGKTQSCGCFASERLVERNTTHRGASLPEYGVWRSMMDRCYRPSNTAYKNYGARGISVCRDWHVFGKFYADMGARPTPRHSIERVNNDRGYSKDNCIWANRSQQMLNRRLFSNNSSGFRGVQLHQGKFGDVFYRAFAQFDGRRAYLGSFKSVKEATEARRVFFNQRGVTVNE